MLQRACTTLVTGLAVATALGSLLLGIGVEAVAANGPHVESREVYKGPAGPYELRVLTAPVVGTLHLSIAVFDGDGLPVPAVPDVSVTGRGPEGEGQASGPVSGVEVFASPGWYAADLPVESTGEWTLSVALTGPEGPGDAEFPVEVQSASGTNWFVVGAFAIVAVLFVRTAFSWRRRRGRGTPSGRGGRTKQQT